MLGKRSILGGIVIIIAILIFFLWANAYYLQNLISVLLLVLVLLAIIGSPIVLVYLVINSLRSHKPNLGNYIHSNRLLKIGFYFLAGGIGTSTTILFLYAITLFSNSFLPRPEHFLPLLPGILLISIGIIKLSALKKASLGIGVGIIVLMIVFVNYQSNYQSIPRGDFMETPQFESLKILGYDARDLNELTAHDGITMLKNSAGIQNNAKEKDERIAIYLQNDGVQPVTISEVGFAGTVYNFQGNVGVIDNYEGTAPSQGNYVILTDGASGLLQSSGELQPGQIVTIVLDLVDSYDMKGPKILIKITTSNGDIFVGGIAIGLHA